MKILLTFFVAVMSFLPAALFAADSTEIEAKLHQFYPKYKAERIEKSPIEGLYMIFGEKNILYFAPATGHLLVGDMWSADGTNLTESARQEKAISKMKQLPLDLAVKVGNGPKTVIEITDPDCPYCRRGSAFFASREDVTRYVFFFPLKIHPNAADKAEYILSANDKAKAYEEIMSGKYDKTALPEFDHKDRLSKHIKIVSSLGVRGTPAYWANGVFVSGADTSKLNQVLQ